MKIGERVRVTNATEGGIWPYEVMLDENPDNYYDGTTVWYEAELEVL